MSGAAVTRWSIELKPIVPLLAGPTPPLSHLNRRAVLELRHKGKRSPVLAVVIQFEGGEKWFPIGQHTANPRACVCVLNAQAGISMFTNWVIGCGCFSIEGVLAPLIDSFELALAVFTHELAVARANDFVTFRGDSRK